MFVKYVKKDMQYFVSFFQKNELIFSKIVDFAFVVFCKNLTAYICLDFAELFFNFIKD